MQGKQKEITYSAPNPARYQANSRASLTVEYQQSRIAFAVTVEAQPPWSLRGHNSEPWRSQSPQ